MKKIAVVTDSHSSISSAEAAMLGVHVLPMPFEVDGQDYFEGVNLTRQQFFGYQRAGAHIGTSQPAPAAVMELWDKLLLEYESILYMPISSGLSNSCQTATDYTYIRLCQILFKSHYQYLPILSVCQIKLVNYS